MTKSAKDSKTQLESLLIDKLYRNTNNWKNPLDEFNNFFRFSDDKGINNVSGFRPKTRSDIKDKEVTNCAFCVLITNLGEPEWPDELNLETGQFVYYGDNRHPGKAIDDTPVGGNKLLQVTYNHLHAQSRSLIKPFLCFQAVKDADGSYMKFLGLAAPGARGVSSVEDLVGVWKVKNSERFQNYRAIFTILKESSISKLWLEDLVKGILPNESSFCPEAWKYWVKTGIYKALECDVQLSPRLKKDQLPVTKEEDRVLNYLIESLDDREFEYAAAEIIRLLDPRFKDLYVTRATKDGGRDVIGQYHLGHSGHIIRLSAFIEAKKWKKSTSVGVKPLLRLISRLKHRDIGVFMTTSYFDKQIQEELIEDGHSVILISGGDIARLIIRAELSKPEILKSWVNSIKLNVSR